MTQLSAKDREDYLFLLYFGGAGKTVIERCIDRAYRDLCRTLRGLSVHKGHTKLTDDARQLLKQRLEGPLQSNAILSQADFDTWHEHLAQELCSLYGGRGFKPFSAGQAKKWINMALKYAVIFGDERVPGIKNYFSYLHVPVDSVVMKEINGPDAPQRPKEFSKLDYTGYFSIQKWIRKSSPSEPPLGWEFRIWNKAIDSPSRPST